MRDIRGFAEQLISGKEDAANNFARGHYTIGKVGPVSMFGPFSHGTNGRVGRCMLHIVNIPAASRERRR